jgi:CHAT domain-containing protein
LLRIEELQRWRLPRARLVVLAACETAVGNVFRGEGAVSLARPFLRAGAASVIGSLWRVDDRTARPVIVMLHRSFVRSGDAVEALRTAQLGLLNGSDPTGALARSWGSFIAMGTAAPR